MRLDRDLQRKVLEACASIYPKPADPTKVAVACEADEDGFNANVAYLAEHGLVDCEVRRVGGEVALTVCAITARGLDFLADDGGLTAILGTVTVKLHADTIREMLIARVDSSSESAEKKGLLRKQIAALPGTALQALTTHAAQEGLAHVPDLWHWIQGVIGL